MTRRSSAGITFSGGSFMELVRYACEGKSAESQVGVRNALVKSPVYLERIAPRYVFERWIWIHRGADGKKGSLQAWTRDLSETGLAAFSAQALAAGEMVILEIMLPHLEALRIPAKVARTLGTEYGFQFTALSSEQRADIRKELRGASAVPASRSRKSP